MDIDQVMPLSTFDNQWLFTHPLLHLRERMPDISVIQPFKLFVVRGHSGHEFNANCKVKSEKGKISETCLALLSLTEILQFTFCSFHFSLLQMPLTHGEDARGCAWP